jgi:hypothetical protein
MQSSSQTQNRSELPADSSNIGIEADKTLTLLSEPQPLIRRPSVDSVYPKS